MKKKYSKLVSDMGLFAIGSLGSKLLLFLLIPLYTNFLSKTEYGIGDLVFTISELVLPFVSLAIFNGLLRFGLMPGKAKEAFQCATVVFIIGSFLTIFLTPFLGFYSPIAKWKWYLCFRVIALFAQSNALIYLKVKDRNRLFAILSIIQALLLVLSNILLLVVLKQGIKGYLISSIFASATTAVLAVVIAKEWKDLNFSIDRNLLKEMLWYSTPFIFNDISWWFIHSSDKVMIEWLISSSVLGIYTAASKIPSLINTLSSIFSQAWGIASIKEYDSSNDESFYSTVFHYFSIAIFGACILIISVVKPFMQLYVGAEFEDAWHYVPLLLFSATIASVSTFAGSLLGAVKKSGMIMWSTIIAAVVNIIANYYFISVFDTWGAVIGTCIAYVVVASVRLMASKHYISIDFHYETLVPLFIITLVEAICVGLDFHLIITSTLAMALFLLVVRKRIIAMIHSLKTNSLT